MQSERVRARIPNTRTKKLEGFNTDARGGALAARNGRRCFPRRARFRTYVAAGNKVFQTLRAHAGGESFPGAKSRLPPRWLLLLLLLPRESLRGKRAGNFPYNGPRARKGNSLKWVKADSA